jgi:uncharacterized membrane protein YsdA (DUF1294 family)
MPPCAYAFVRERSCTVPRYSFIVPSLLRIVAVAYALGSAISFSAFGIDKRRAVRRERRVSERTLHTLELCFGWPGALAGMLVFRHKIAKRGYLFVTAFVVLLHVAAVTVAVVLAPRV